MPKPSPHHSFLLTRSSSLPPHKTMKHLDSHTALLDCVLVIFVLWERYIEEILGIEAIEHCFVSDFFAGCIVRRRKPFVYIHLHQECPKTRGMSSADRLASQT